MNMTKESLQKKYDPRKTEKLIYKQWEEDGYFNPDRLPAYLCSKKAKPFTMVMPPPNITGSLHMGHFRSVFQSTPAWERVTQATFY
jgi:valyl-tRNA synthetase